jgi:hypothetical protein
MRRNVAQEEGDTWAQADTDQSRRGWETALVRSDEGSAQAPLRCLTVLHLNGDRRAAVRDDANRRVSLSVKDPEASDKRAQRVGGLVEVNLSAMDESAADTHRSADCPRERSRA